MNDDNRPKPFKDRDDAHHVLAQLPRLAPPEKVHPMIREALDNWKPGDGNLVIAGPTNSGKTSGVANRCRALLEEYESATSMIFAEAQELVADPQLRERAKRVKILIVDDLGQEADDKNRLFLVYNHRYVRGLDTITTTGWRIEDLERRPGMSSALIKRIKHKSRRGRYIPGKTIEVFKQRPPAVRHAVGSAQNPTPFSEAADR